MIDLLRRQSRAMICAALRESIFHVQPLPCAVQFPAFNVTA